MNRILVTGASGFLGYTLCNDLAAAHDVIAAFHTHFPAIEACRPTALDITSTGQVQTRFEELRPEVVIHSAALSQPDACERDPDAAHSIIVEGSRNVATYAREYGCRLFHISTDLVFDGEKGNYTEEDPVRGVSVYSRCKIAAEEIVRELSPAAVVLRVSVLYGEGSPYNRGFLGSMLAAWRAGKTMTFFTDQFRTPTFGPQVSRVIDALISRRDLGGTFHVGGAERLSRYEFALMVAGYAGVPAGLVRPGSMHDVEGAAPRGADCSLISEKLRAAAGVAPLACTAALDTLTRNGLLTL